MNEKHMVNRTVWTPEKLINLLESYDVLYSSIKAARELYRSIIKMKIPNSGNPVVNNLRAIDAVKSAFPEIPDRAIDLFKYRYGATNKIITVEALKETLSLDYDPSTIYNYLNKARAVKAQKIRFS